MLFGHETSSIHFKRLPTSLPYLFLGSHYNSRNVVSEQKCHGVMCLLSILVLASFMALYLPMYVVNKSCVGFKSFFLFIVVFL